ncbi:MAG: GC-type dockerin domain-anchored protein [Phycisphaerales bacterium]|jgi:hypothetical protein
MSIARLVAFTSLAACTLAHAQDCAPNPPAGVSVSNTGPCGSPLVISWSPSPGALAYQIFRGTTPNFADAVQRGVSGGSPIQDGSVPPLVPQYYWIRAFNDCGVSDPAGGASSMRLATPATPTNVRASDASTCNSVVVTWNASMGAQTYRVYRSTSASSSGATLVATVPDPEFWDPSAPAGILLYYFVDAGNGCGRSALSSPDTGRRGSTANFRRQPSDATVDAGDTVRLVSWAEGNSMYHWMLNDVPLSDIPGRISGTTSTELSIANVTPADAGAYSLVAVTPCGTITSRQAILTVNDGATCPADFNQDGGVDGTDVEVFMLAWEGGAPEADVNLDGGIDGSDVEVFFVAWSAGGC